MTRQTRLKIIKSKRLLSKHAYVIIIGVLSSIVVIQSLIIIFTI